jgi:hypothetical protein
MTATPEVTTANLWDLPVSGGIEVKYWQIEGKLPGALKGLRGDLQKLTRFRMKRPDFLGVALGVVQSKRRTLGDALWNASREFAVEGLHIPESGTVAVIVTAEPPRLWTVQPPDDWCRTP